MKAFITGLGGFIGSHLAELLLENGIRVYGTVYNNTRRIKEIDGDVTAEKCDILDKNGLEHLITKVNPDYIFHLAAQSFVTPSWKDPEHTILANVIGTLNVLDIAKSLKIKPKIAVACSSAEYGSCDKKDIPIKEGKEFSPSSPYAVSKIGTDMISYLYWKTYGMDIFRLRFFNTTGPRKEGDACSDFAKMITIAEKENINSIKVGYLDSIRDYTDVRDSVKAVWLIINKGKPGDAYNICTGRGYKVKDLLDTLLKSSNKKITVKYDSSKTRPLEDPIFVGDNSKIKSLGCKPEISIQQTLIDILKYWRKRV